MAATVCWLIYVAVVSSVSPFGFGVVEFLLAVLLPGILYLVMFFLAPWIIRGLSKNFYGLTTSALPFGPCGQAVRILALKYPIHLEQDEDGMFIATCPTLPGCVSQGQTRAEATANIHEAIEGYLQSLVKHGDPMPQP